MIYTCKTIEAIAVRSFSFLPKLLAIDLCRSAPSNLHNLPIALEHLELVNLEIMPRRISILALILISFINLDFCHALIVKQPENAWSDEVVPAAIDPEVARLVELMNKPEPWDHN